MKRLFLVLGTALMIMSWFTGAKAQADLIQWSVSAATATEGEYSIVSTTPFPGIPGSETYIQLSPESTINGANSATVALISLNASVDNFGGQINGEFSSPSSNYQLSLALTDQASGASGTLTFSGYFSGILPTYGYGGTLTNTFVGPTTQTLKLGSDLYTVTIGPAVLPVTADPYTDNPNDTVGSISATISVQPLTSSTPEPSTLLLACLGLPSLGLTGWFRRRKAGKVGRILETHAASSA